MSEMQAAQGTETKLSFKPENFAADMAALAMEQGIKPVEVPAVEAPTTPTQPEPVKVEAVVTPEATKVEVPEKFQTPDGKLDEEKLRKSTENVDDALTKYLEKEKELKRKINEVRAKENAYINPKQSDPSPIPVNSSFAQKLEQDIANEGAGAVLAKLFTASQESVEERVRQQIQTLQNAHNESVTKLQIEDIGKKDPWVYTQDGMATLTKILDEQPYMWQAKDPYKAAYLVHKGQQVVSKSSPQVLTPTPSARPSAPVPTGQAANQTSNPTIKLDSKEAINNHLKGLTVQQQSEFFKKMGFPAF